MSSRPCNAAYSRTAAASVASRILFPRASTTGIPNSRPSSADRRPQTLMDKTVKFFYSQWQRFGSKKPGRPPGQEHRFWGVERPGFRSDYLDESSAKEAPHE